MSTLTRSELSKKNRFYISKERFLELKHFCLQYPEWKKEITAIDNGLKANNVEQFFDIGDISITESVAIERMKWQSKIDKVENAARRTDPEFYYYIIKSVTEGRSCNYLITFLKMPCCRDRFYLMYRKFFYILSNS